MLRHRPGCVPGQAAHRQLIGSLVGWLLIPLVGVAYGNGHLLFAHTVPFVGCVVPPSLPSVPSVVTPAAVRTGDAYCCPVTNSLSPQLERLYQDSGP